jgi:hypothetical protein
MGIETWAECTRSAWPGRRRATAIARRLHWLARVLCTAGVTAAAPALAWHASVLDVVELPAAWRAHELSGLAWVPAPAALLAVSDRGLLWRLPVQLEAGPDGERLRLGTMTPAVALAAPPPNAEGLAWREPGPGLPQGALIVADERGHRALIVDTQGRHRGDLPLPGPADMAARLRGANAGIEALAWHPAHGLIAAPQRPLRGADPQVHRMHATDGRHWDLRAAGGRSALKAIERVTPDTLLVLERIGGGRAQAAVLRALPLAGCGGMPCDPPALPLADARLRAGDNLEGLACPREDRCLIVSDDGGAPTGRTVLVLVGLRR